MTDSGTGAPPPATGGGAGLPGLTRVDLEGLHEVGTGLGTLADTLGQALHAVDSLPLETLRPALGPIGGEFLAAWLAATERHRSVLAGVTDVADAAGELVLSTERLYASTDERSAASFHARGAGGDVGRVTEV